MELPERAFDAGVYLYGQCEVARATVERHHILDIETGALRVIGATARALETAELKSILAGAGFPAVEFHPCWDGLDFDASADWLVAISR
jgi:hypothetical protein